MNTLHKLTGRARSILHIFTSLSVVLLNIGPLALPAGAATPSFKQVKASTPSSPQSSVATTFAQAQIAGDLNVVVVGWNQATGTVNAVTDSKGNVYQVAAPLARGTNLSQVVYYAKNIVAASAGANTVTVTFSAAATYADVRILEYAGLDTVSPLDVTAAASGTAANASSGAVTTHAASELLVGAGTTAGAFSAAGTSFTSRIITTDDDIAEDRNVTTAGSYSATATAKGGAWLMQLVAFKAAAGTDTTAPSAPASPTATATSSTQVNLAWTASTDNVGVTGYQIERCQASACTNFALLTTVTGTTYSNTGLAPSTLYRYRLRATDAAGNLSAYSAIVEATTQGTPDTTPPSVPTGLTGTGASISQINLSWTASTDNIAVTGYKVFRGGAQIGTSTGTSFQDTGLAVNTSYSYTVSAFDAAGNASAQTAAVAASTLPDTTSPSVPTGLTAQVVSSTQINLSWTASTDNVGVSGYRLYRNGSLINTVTVTPVQDAGLTAGTTYSYTVSAFDAAGNASAQTAAVQATTPAPDNTPPAVSMTAPQNGTTVSGTTTFSANASDTGSGVHDVEFLLDGVTLSDDTTSPYSYAWDTTTTTNGVHHLAVRAHDNAGNFSNTSGAFTVTVNNQPSQLPVDLMAGYPFTESTGTTTADVTSYGNVASFNSLANPVWSSGKYGSGVKFDGATTSYLSVADSSTMDISGTALTLSMWINPSGSSTGDQVVFGKFWNGTGSAPHYQYGLELDRGTQPHFYIGTTSNTSVGAAMGSNLPLGQWSHLAVSFDGSRANFYLDGNLVSSPSVVGGIASRTGSTIRLGNDIDGSQGFKGTLDDVRLYRRTESQADIQTDKNTPLVGNGSGTGPSIAISTPTQNAQVGGIVTVTADAADAVGVQFFVDGTAVGVEDTAAPFAANWDTRASSSGAHTITARARDANGNTTVSNPITVNVANTDTFQNEILATGFNLPTAMKFLPDGRMLVAELGGKIWIVPAPYTTPNSTPFLNIPVGAAGVQEGIFDFALDPNFTTNHYFYVYYTAPSITRDRLSRFTATADFSSTIAGSEVVLYQDPTDLASDEHHGGAIAFSNDNKIFFTTGEHFQGAPAQDLTSPYGKIHRINMDGTAPTDNPYYDGAGPHWDSVWAIGLRNPYRAYFDAPTNRLLVGDVGGNDYNTAQEEVDLGAPGANYGWPNCELGTCNQGYTPALYAYAHNGRDAAITGGFVYHANGASGAFPSGMEGSYFFGDYAQNWIKRLTFDAQGNVSGVFNFEPASGVVDGPYGDIVYLTEGPDGSLYYIDLGYSDTTGTFGVSKIHRIRYQASNQSPSAAAAADVTTGPAPLAVNFSSAGSTDPEGQPLTYSWDFGDGTPLSTAANPAHTYTTAGVYTARLTVSDGVNNTFSPPVTIQVGSAPVATINAPTDGATFRAGDVITYSGDATDPDDGNLPASAFSWTIDFLHEGHIHPGPTATGTKSGSFTIPTTGHDFSGNTRYRITLTVTDSNGLTNTKSVIIWPQKVNLTFDTVPTGVTLYLDGIAKTTPFVYDTLIGFNHTIEARNTTVGSTSYTFSSWSDGGAQQHTLVVPATNQSYTASYAATTVSNGPAAAWGFNENTGTTSADATGHGNTATLMNGATWAAGKHGSALSLDGTNDYLALANSSSLDIAGNALTLSMWINPGSVTGDSVVLGKFWNTGMTSPYYQYGIEMSGGKPNLQIGTATSTLSAAMDTALPANQWSYLTVVFNGTQVLFYVNGTLASTKPLTASITARGQVMRLGADANTQQFFKGLLDDVRLYNRTLTPAEIQTDMNTGL